MNGCRAVRGQGGFCCIFKSEIFEQISHHLLMGINQRKEWERKGWLTEKKSPGSKLLMSPVGEKKVKNGGRSRVGGGKDKFTDLVAQVRDKSHLRQKRWEDFVKMLRL